MALDLGVGVWARGPVRRRPHGGLRAIGRGRHPGRDHSLPNTFASVDHPFHVARAEILWRELASGNLLRWIGQHQGGYPVEFYPLARPGSRSWSGPCLWERCLPRAPTPSRSSRCSSHRVRRLPPWPRRTAGPQRLLSPPSCCISHSPVAGTTADTPSSCSGAWSPMSPAQCRTLHAARDRQVSPHRRGWAGAAAAVLGALAIYCNPRSLLALVALGLGAWLAGILRAMTESRYLAAAEGGDPSGRDACAGDVVAPTAAHHRWSRGPSGSAIGVISIRLALVAALTGLLAAPELMALARFGDLYTFVQYSGYTELPSTR